MTGLMSSAIGNAKLGVSCRRCELMQCAMLFFLRFGLIYGTLRAHSDISHLRWLIVDFSLLCFLEDGGDGGGFIFIKHL